MLNVYAGQRERAKPSARCGLGVPAPLHLHAAFGRSSQRLLARSRTPLAQVPVGSPFLAAASSYAFRRALVSLISSRSFSGSSIGGRPLPLLGASIMGAIMARTNISRNPLTGGLCAYILSVQ
jgi:hypothetical protein